MILVGVIRGLFGCQAVMAALIARLRGRAKGRYIDCNLMQCATAFQAPRIMEHDVEGGRPEVMYVPPEVGF